jgi:hypothetical protein
MEEPEKLMVSHLGKVLEACHEEPYDPKDQHDDADDQGIHLVERFGARLAVDLDPEPGFWIS